MSTTEKKLYAVIGDPVGHSLSPAMHNGAFASLGMNAEYIAVRVAAEDLKDFTDSARSKLSGFNITVPHKNAVIPYLDEVSGLASLCGSVNTVIVSEDGKLSGDTTDGYGLSGALREAFAFDFKDSAVTFIGCGGVVNALAFHAAFSGASSVRIINRTLEKAQVLASKLCAAFPECSFDIASGAETRKIREFLNTSALAVQCTSLGLKDGDPAPVDPCLFPREIFYFDTIYRETSLLKALRERGIRVCNGSGMLLHQGARSFELWTGREAPLEAMRSALECAGKRK